MRFLDLDGGTGDPMRLAGEHFEEVIGVDPGEKPLAHVLAQHRGWRLLSRQGDRLPLAEGSIDVVGMCALLQHLRDLRPALAEAFRILRPGGMLYTDHDRNLTFWRCHGFAPRLASSARRRQSFGSDLEDVTETHHIYSDGLDPKRLARACSPRSVSRRSRSATVRPSIGD